YGLIKKRKETINGVRVIRVPLIPRGKDNLLLLAINYFSYTFFLILWSFFLALFNRFDFIFVHHTSPIFLGIPAVLVKRMQKIKMYFWNLDLWPESVSETTGFNNHLIMKGLDKIVRLIYHNSDKILIGSNAFKGSIMSKGVDENKFIYFPNWAEDVFLTQEFNRVDLTEYKIDNDSLKIMFAGNIGVAQDMENVMAAIEITSKDNSPISWIFIGEGRKTDWMKGRVRDLHLEKFVLFLGQFPMEQMPSFFNLADVMMVTLKDKKIFSYTAPAKIQAYMASSKPILAMINGEGANIINDADCGIVCNAGDYESLAMNVLKFAKISEQERMEMGKNGYNFYNKFFSKQKAMDSLINMLGN
ncbi:MAG: glycosyltransferase family 4 protein, partial [Ignavibacteria bacterium]|nr:glycosyltransferase family 4 protein [Ignavibacteria bacterium]